ncbi:hypothetical protein Acr_00g0005210 [Actinidia rufa]|uniref:Uncharacterized protein n=1 Tax=Actinidia rufa TaxID=165716 RepID=A0A7J0D7Q9_9ERIC|nr:hypothetical protein Acr_00g0005210 [Actinidia rufa]
MLCAPGNPQGLHFCAPPSPLLRDTALYREVEPPFLTMEADLQQLKKTQHRRLQHWLQQQMKTFICRQEGIIKYSIWLGLGLGPGPNSVGLPSAMQPPIGVQKWERVLCLPLARSTLPCRLTRHSALGTVRLCPIGLARHSTPGMVLVIKCSSLAAKYCHYVRMALLGWLYTVGSAQLALLSWLCTVGSAQLALHGWLCSVVRDRCNLRVARISFKHVYGLTVGAIKYGMQVICIKQVRAHGRSKQVPNAANYCCQTYVALGMLRQMQLSVYTARTYVVLGILRYTQLSAYYQTYVVLGILRHTQLSAYYQTYVVLGILRHTQLSAYYQTYVVLGILRHTQLSVYYQTYVVLGILRHTQLSAYYQTYVVLGILRHTQLSAYYQNLPLVHTTKETTATNLERKIFDSASSRL